MDLEKEISELRSRVQKLEEDRDRFLAALKGAAQMCLSNPMVRSIIPKEVKETLERMQ